LSPVKENTERNHIIILNDDVVDHPVVDAQIQSEPIVDNAEEHKQDD
jgi:hypothetical protein